ncbi:hypothetical protein HCG51_31875 [Tolypothrix sp. PCC 7910]|uniref:hypothetical protein n=1 Tax=Tolypothrix sp. PCC 7910 TaxID=2099387 RepID=UPI0014277803|nr:hypothetical protein [Tolypothrix sp. PCC 7910]QIR40833.1 hypothetical protein HCG51_31875 [Tolypothrix sp. PCC 7910]
MKAKIQRNNYNKNSQNSKISQISELTELSDREAEIVVGGWGDGSTGGNGSGNGTWSIRT